MDGCFLFPGIMPGFNVGFRPVEVLMSACEKTPFFFFSSFFFLVLFLGGLD